MPWNQTSPIDQNANCVADYLRDRLSVSELCQLYHVSRGKGDKWIDRSVNGETVGRTR